MQSKCTHRRGKEHSLVHSMRKYYSNDKTRGQLTRTNLSNFHSVFAHDELHVLHL